MIACPYCNCTEYWKTGVVKGSQRYQCRQCKRKYRMDTQPKAEFKLTHNHCLQCGSETTNERFCSRTCAATYNGKRYPKRKKYCKYCGTRIHGQRTVCDECNPSYVDWSKRTIGDIQKSAKYQVSAALRTLARQEFAKSDRLRVCQNCGYDKHVEVCHIKGINTFSPDTPVLIVSSIDNLVGLCPNCHWGFDHGLLLYENIPPLK